GEDYELKRAFVVIIELTTPISDAERALNGHHVGVDGCHDVEVDQAEVMIVAWRESKRRAHQTCYRALDRARKHEAHSIRPRPNVASTREAERPATDFHGSSLPASMERP